MFTKQCPKVIKNRQMWRIATGDYVSNYNMGVATPLPKGAMSHRLWLIAYDTSYDMKKKFFCTFWKLLLFDEFYVLRRHLFGFFTSHWPMHLAISVIKFLLLKPGVL